MEQRTSLLELIGYIDPADLDYQSWVNVGMALKQEGYAVSDWDAWSHRDPGRYHAGECSRKWETFRGNGNPVTGGTIVQMAMERGWIPEKDHELDWDDVITCYESGITDKKEQKDQKNQVKEPEAWEPLKELKTYIETLFEAEEKVGYVTKVLERDGKKSPSRGCFNRTAGQLLQALERYQAGDIEDVVGDYDLEAGAWIRFNPLDGKGCSDKNVTDYRYALVESDDQKLNLKEQQDLLRSLELPVACLVHSGNKSLHAVVRVEASSREEYDERVRYLYEVCETNGLKVDRNNKNPSRLSRMPGILRGGKKQFLISTNTGKASWKEWKQWVEKTEIVEDDLPEPESIADVWDNLPELSPPLIEGVLRQGHKMLLAGPSKAGKSFGLIELSIAIAEGRKWFAWNCTRGRVLYVNLELDRASCLHRFKDVYEALGWTPDHLDNIHVWNLRGKSVPMDRLSPKLIRRAVKKNYIAVIIDPIYKVITGDENSADQMAAFCNQFDKVCTELGTAVIYCHHHSKGSQGGKRSMDRASGSGVFARDPDALLDLIELELNEDILKQEENKAVCDACKAFLKEEDYSQDDAYSAIQMMNLCRKKLSKKELSDLETALQKEKRRVREMSAWRVEGTLREFPKFPPVNLWFMHPIHHIDPSGVLGDIQPEADRPPWQKKKKTPEERKKEKNDSLRAAFEANDLEGVGSVKLSELMTYMGVSANTMKKYVDESEEFKRENGMVLRASKKKSDT